MPWSFESGVLLGHVYTLADGSCVRLRLARTSDLVAIRGLLAQVGLDLEAARLVHFDPRRRYVVCATGLSDCSETLLGVGSIRLDSGPSAEPDLLVLADDSREELRRLLGSVLVDAAKAYARAA